MDYFLKKLKTLFEGQNKFYLLIGLGFVFILIMIIWQIVSSEKAEKSDLNTIDQPFSYDDNVSIQFEDEDLFNEFKKNEANIYSLEANNHSELVQSFLNKIGKGFLKKQNFDSIYYIWSKNTQDNYYLVDYDTVKDFVFFRFEEPIVLDEIKNFESAIFSNPENILEDFAFSYFNLNFKYETPKVTTIGNEYRIQARRIIDGIPLEVKGQDSFTDYLVFDKSGKLKEGSFLLADYTDPVNAKLFPPDYLGSSINRSEYPKDIISKLPSDFSLEDFGYKPYKYEEGSLGDPPPVDFDEQDLIPSSCKVTTFELVYYFINSSAEKLTPVYKLGCKGEITFQDKSFTVPVTIFANALDPDLVYIPSSEVDNN